MPLRLEVPPTLRGASGPQTSLPSYKFSCALSPVFLTFAKSAPLSHSTQFNYPLFSITSTLLQKSELPSPSLSRAFALFAANIGGSIGISKQNSQGFFLTGGTLRLSGFTLRRRPLHRTLSRPPGRRAPCPFIHRLSMPSPFPYWHLSKTDITGRIGLAAPLCAANMGDTR